MITENQDKDLSKINLSAEWIEKKIKPKGLRLAYPDKVLLDYPYKVNSKALLDFVCEAENHVFESSLSATWSRKHPCLICSNQIRASQQEKDVVRFIKSTLKPTVSLMISHWLPYGIPSRTSTGFTVDALLFNELTEQKIVFEYDGARWHKDKITVDTEKTTVLLNEEYIVFRIREQGIPLLDIQSSRLYQISVPKNVKLSLREPRGVEAALIEILTLLDLTDVQVGLF